MPQTRNPVGAKIRIVAKLALNNRYVQ